MKHQAFKSILTAKAETNMYLMKTNINSTQNKIEQIKKKKKKGYMREN